jgi:hypothetical protein
VGPALPSARVVTFAVLFGAAGAFAGGDRVDVRTLFPRGDRPVRVGRTPPGVGGDTVEACARCHAEIASEWRASQHSTSWTDDVFQAAYGIEPMQFCRNCHAPRTRVGRVPDHLAQAEGVSCAVCHVRDGHVLGPGRARAPTPGAHASLALVRMRASAFCEGCHQFNFPGDSGPAGEVYATDEPMQDTHAEWAMSSHAAQGTHCQDCHMPWVSTPDGRRHRSHRFPGGSDRALLESAVRVECDARVEASATVARVRVLPGNIGHSFPTGDLFRRAELKVWVDGDEAHAQTLGLAREFRPELEHDPHGRPLFVRRQSLDTRVPPPGTGTIPYTEMRFGVRARVVHWRLDHLLMPTPMAASQGFGEPRVRTLVTEGTFEVPSPGVNP